MTDELPSMLRRYADTKQDIHELIESYREQEEVFRTLVTLGDDDLREVNYGMEILPEAVHGFFSELERIAASGRIDLRETVSLALCLRAAISGCSLTFRHLEVSSTLRAGLLKEKTISANQGKSKKRDIRFDIARPIIHAAPKKQDGSLLNINKVLAEVNAALTAEKLPNGQSIHKGVSVRTLGRYFDDWRAASAE